VGARYNRRTWTRIIAVANQKGGVAKTTTVAALAAAMSERGRSVLAVDLDPQACLTFSLGFEPDDLDPTVHDVLVGRCEVDAAIHSVSDEDFDLVPSNIDVAGAEAYLLTRMGREYALRKVPWMRCSVRTRSSSWTARHRSACSPSTRSPPRTRS
jgi:chromosome partitioning protein